MSSRTPVAKAAAFAAIALASSAANAALIVYTSPSDLASATFATATDTFENVPAAAVPSPSNRTAGGYAYTVGAAGSLYGSGSGADRWLSTDLSGDTITFSGFAAAVRGIGGYFFGSDLAGAFLGGQTITLTALDSSGATAVESILNATETSFRGFVTTASLTSLTVSIGSTGAFATVDDLVIAQVPEPSTWALVLFGCAAAGARARRRRPR